MQSLFNNKYKVQHLSWIIYKGVCSDHTGETKGNVDKRWNAHESVIEKNWECSKHLPEHFNHEVHWSLLSIVLRKTFKWKILEACFIKIMKPSLSSKINSDVLTLFKHGITLTRNPKSFVTNHFSDKHSVYIFS